MNTEVWKDIPGFEGCYQVSNLGRVRSLDRKVKRGNHFAHYKGKLLSPAAYTKQGHLSLPLGSKSHGRTVHGLVAEAFIGPCPDGHEVLHTNGCAFDNRVANLRYGTRTENNQDITKHGRRRLSTADVRAIRTRYRQGETQTALALEFGVCLSQVNNVIHRRQYAHVA